MATPYERGRTFEYRVRDHLRDLGYAAERSFGSRGPYDVRAEGGGLLLLVQAKFNGYIPPREWNQLFDVALELDGIPLVCGKAGRRLTYQRLMARKDTTRRIARQPLEFFDPPRLGLEDAA